VATTLSAAQVAALTKDGDHYVSRNLYLEIRNDGRSRAWVFRYRYRGRLRRMGLGPQRLLTLSEARRRAVDAQKLLGDGIDPLVAKRAAHAAVLTNVPTFGAVSEEYIASRKGSWRDGKRAAQWTASLKTHCARFYRLPVNEVTLDNVVAALRPIWGSTSDMAGKVRGRIEAVLDYAVAKKHRPEGPNPAAWRGPLGALLPPLSQVRAVTHHPAVPYAEIPALFSQLQAVGTVTSQALSLVLLTAVRSGEARLARWREFDFAARTWTIPPERTKTGVEHVVPLTDAVIALLPEPGRPDALVFTGARRGKPLSDATMLKALRKLRSDSSVHGLRSSFRTWAAESTDHPAEIAEAALAHRVGDDVVRAYLRTSFFDRRKTLMQDWADFATGQVSTR
jgi:integrase